MLRLREEVEPGESHL